MDLSEFNCITIVQGEFAVADGPNDLICTLLGSCVATCLFDPGSKIGGMNHFLLPGERSGSGEGIKHGLHAMELLLNALLRAGCSRTNLRAKVFGGAQLLNSKDIGAQNFGFARWFLDNEAIPLVAESVGGKRGRRIRFWPSSGVVHQVFMPGIEMPGSEATEATIASQGPKSGDIDLFG